MAGSAISNDVASGCLGERTRAAPTMAPSGLFWEETSSFAICWSWPAAGALAVSIWALARELAEEYWSRWVETARSKSWRLTWWSTIVPTRPTRRMPMTQMLATTLAVREDRSHSRSARTRTRRAPASPPLTLARKARDVLTLRCSLSQMLTLGPHRPGSRRRGR